MELHDDTTPYAATLANWALDADSSVTFGARLVNKSGTFHGSLESEIEEARLYDGALTQSEIQALVAVPEPSSAALIGLGGLALILRRRK